MANPDTWWHLETGRYVCQTHHLPSPDPFAFTTAAAKPAYPGEEIVRRFNLTHEWLAQTIFYLAWAAGGFPALILLRAAMLTAFCGLAGLVAFHRTGGFHRSLAAALVTAAIAGNFAADRPFLFTYLLLAVTIYILETAGPPEAVAAAADLPFLGQLPRRLFPGLGRAGGLLPGLADSGQRRAAARGPPHPVDGERPLGAGLRRQPQRLSRARG